jgi:hypothetical protein
MPAVVAAPQQPSLRTSTFAGDGPQQELGVTMALA